MKIYASGAPVRLFEELEDDVWPELEWVMQDYNILSMARQGPISIPDLEAFMRIFHRGDQQFFVKAILALDREMMDYQRRLAEAKSNGS